jgi:hypothetical protein
MRTVLITGVLVAACGSVSGKLPPPDDASKAKAAETAAKAAWQAKVDAYQLCKSQDKVVAVYMKGAGKSAPKPGSTAVAGAPAASTASAAQPASGTPAAAKAPPCVDPGPFAYNPPEQKPLEASGAHSPTGTAAAPPSGKDHSAEMAPNKK